MIREEYRTYDVYVVPYISSNIHLTFPIFLEGNVFARQTLECHRYSIQLRGELK